MRLKLTITVLAVAAVLVAALLATGILGTAGGGGSAGSGGSANGRALRLGYVADVAQAPALVGLRAGLFAVALRGSGVALRPVAFRTDAAESAALAAGQLDAAYASPDAILAVLAARRAPGISVISGAAEGGAELVVRPGITSPGGLRGRTIAVPVAGGAQDTALRSWLAGHGISAGRGGVTVTAVAPDEVVGQFRAGHVSGAWVPAPWDVELVDAGGRVLAGESGMPPGSRPAAVDLVVTRAFLGARDSAVMALLKGQVRANDYLRQSLLRSAVAVSAQIAAVTGQPLPAGVVGASLLQVTFTDDPAAVSLSAQVRQAAAAGQAGPAAALPTLYDLGPLNLVLRVAGEPPVSG